MDSNHHLLFEVGQEAEAKSFQIGFRGAWFRCKIKEKGYRRRRFVYFLEYYDYPDEKTKWTQLYQKSPYISKKKKLDLMVRPSFPAVFHQREMPDAGAVSDVIVIVRDVWKVGDLVDWWADGCYWSGKITKILQDDKFQVELPDPPVGEGSSYEAFSKDLRPSLDWFPQHGWTVPSSMDDESDPLAHIVQPSKKVGMEEEDLVVEDSQVKTCSETAVPHPMNVPISIFKDKGDIDSAVSQPMDWSASTLKETTRKRQRVKSCTYGGLSSAVQGDAVESSILELEELACKIKWLKGLLKFGVHWSNAMKPSWNFL